MRVTSITEYHPAAGVVVEFTADVTGDAQRSPIPPSFNQRFHLGDLGEARRVWIAGTFDVPGRIDVDALAWAFTRLIDRHDTLRSSFVQATDGLDRMLHRPGSVEIAASNRTEFDCPTELREHLRRILELRCDARRFPSYTCVAIDRPDVSTVVCAFDHSNVDALSIAVTVDEVRAWYDAYRRCPSSPNIELSPVGGFVDYCRIEATEPAVDRHDERMVRWSEFLVRCGGTTPSFPFDLGLADGETATQATLVAPILDADRTAEFERLCTRSGGGMFAGVVAAIGQACAAIGGPRQIPFLFPLHTRHEDRFRRALGWFTTNAPMTVDVGDVLVDTIAAAQREFRAALPLSTVPIPQVLASLGDTFTLSRNDVFMVSYIDYTRIEGHRGLEESNAHHVSNATVSDDAQFWVSRTTSGLALRARFPDTVLAHSVMTAFSGALVALLAEATDQATTTALKR